MTKKIVKRTDTNNETLYFYTHSDAVDVGEGSSTKSLTEVIDDTLHKSAQTLTNAEKTQVHANLGTESFVGDRAVRYDEAQVLGSSEKTQALVNLGLNGVDDVPTENSNNVVRSGGVKEAIDDFTNRGFIYKGIAPVSAPLGEDKTFYIAKSGDYTAYTGIGDGSFTLNGIAVLTYATTTASGAWTKNDIVLFDEEPTAGSDNLVKSGAVAKTNKEIKNLLSKNLYTTETTVDQSGAITKPANYLGTELLRIDDIKDSRTDGIKVLKGLFGVQQVYCGIAFYNAAMEFMHDESVSQIGNIYDVDNPLPASSIPEDAVYIKLSRYSRSPEELVLDNYGFDTIFEKIKDLPISVEDNLNTESPSSALSANQGVVILDKLKNGWESVDVINLTSIPMMISTNPKEGVYYWISNRSNNQRISAYRHSRVKCHAGDKFFIQANDSKPCTYAWLTQEPTSFAEAKDTPVLLVDGTTPTDIPVGKYSFIEAPAGAEYLYVKRTVTAASGTDLLPSYLLRLKNFQTESVVPVSLRYIYINPNTSQFVENTNSAATRVVKVKEGECIRLKASYTDTSAGRSIYVGFSQFFPQVGGTATIIDGQNNFALRQSIDDYYIAPFDGYFFVTHIYANAYYTNYSISRVVETHDVALPLRSEKILVFGDSILSFRDELSNNRGFVEFLAEYTGATVIRGSIGGTRLVPRSSGAFRAFDISNLIHSWVTNDWTDVDAALETEPSYAGIINNLKSVRPDEITMIVMDGGGNDLSNTNLSFGTAEDADIFNENPSNTTLYGAINYIMRDLFTANPYLKIFFISGLPSYSGSERIAENWCDNRTVTIDGEALSLKEYKAKLAAQCEKWKVPHLLMDNICINPLTFSNFFINTDNSHPYKGFYRMARIIASKLVGNMF